MKLLALTFFVITIFFNVEICNAQLLNLLTPRENFNKEILNDAPGGDSIVLVRIEYTKYYVKQDSNVYYATLSTLNINDFRFFSPPGDKYFGYFVYNGHLILVYGDQHVGYFFDKTEIKKKFPFVSLKEKFDPNIPPVAFEPAYATYEYKNGKFIKPFVW